MESRSPVRFCLLAAMEVHRVDVPRGISRTCLGAVAVCQHQGIQQESRQGPLRMDEGNDNEESRDCPRGFAGRMRFLYARNC